MNSFELLSENIQKKIWEMKWESFTPVQNKTIPVIMNTNKDIVISSDTASGKTEAAFLPILSMVEKNAYDSLKVIYISPLKALINNQFERISELCRGMDIKIHRWHGDVSASRKKKLTDHPSGILQITPESIESLFINRTNYLSPLFKNVEYIIIDEIHSFIGTERGVHLRALLDRLSHYVESRVRIVGLSATISNFHEVKKWISFENMTDVAIIQSSGHDKKLLYSLMYFPEGGIKVLPMKLCRDIRNLTRTRKALIFLNSRARVEELTHILNRLSQIEGEGDCYFPHHSSIDAKLREHVEKEMMKSQSYKSIVSTSTLELGIDIGDIDIVIQVNSTFTVSALKQRLGRSGRKQNSNQILQLYSTEENSLLQSIAVMELNLEGWIEPASEYKCPYDIAFHQIISICAEANGITLEMLVGKLSQMSAFHSLNSYLTQLMIHKMIENNILEELSTREIIVGLEGEKILRSKEFYAVFQSPKELTVYNKARRLGSLDRDPSIQPGNNIILAGKLWTIKEVDFEKDKVYVTTAVNANPPIFSSGNIKIHPRIHEKMVNILAEDNNFKYVSDKGMAALNDMRKKYHFISLDKHERPVWIKNEEIVFETYSGTLISRTLSWMLKAVGLNVKGVDSLGRINIAATSEFELKFQELYDKEWQINDIFEVTQNNEWFASKFSSYLPRELVLLMHEIHEVDLVGAIQFLEEKEIKIIDLTREM